MSENQFDASNVAIRTLQTPLGVKNFQPMGNGLWTVMDASDGAGLAWTYRHAEVVKRRDRAGRIALSLRISPQNAARFQDRFPGKIKLVQQSAK